MFDFNASGAVHHRRNSTRELGQLVRDFGSDDEVSTPRTHTERSRQHAATRSDAKLGQDESGERGPPGEETSWTLALMKRVGVHAGDVNRSSSFGECFLMSPNACSFKNPRQDGIILKDRCPGPSG